MFIRNAADAGFPAAVLLAKSGFLPLTVSIIACLTRVCWSAERPKPSRIGPRFPLRNDVLIVSAVTFLPVTKLIPLASVGIKVFIICLEISLVLLKLPLAFIVVMPYWYALAAKAPDCIPATAALAC